MAFFVFSVKLFKSSPTFFNGDARAKRRARNDSYGGVGHALRRALARRLRAFFACWRNPRGGHLPEGETFAVSEAPVLTGMRADGRLTMSQQGVALGLTSVQFELSLRLRRALKEDPVALRGFAQAIIGAWMECCGMSAL